jgi:hypothetical protein|tara:strand:+ start:631 stop:1350 length:720 start_codon:yes stop_codon:yes gene_type:complete
MPSLVKSSDNAQTPTELFVDLEEKIDRIIARGESASHTQANQPWRGDLLKHANAFVKALASYEINNRTACTSLEGQALRQITDCTIDEIKHRLEKCATFFHPTDDLTCLGVSVVCNPTPLHSHTTECPTHSYEMTLEIGITLPSIRYITDSDDETSAPIPVSTTSGFLQTLFKTNGIPWNKETVMMKTMMFSCHTTQTVRLTTNAHSFGTRNQTSDLHRKLSAKLAESNREAEGHNVPF